MGVPMSSLVEGEESKLDAPAASVVVPPEVQAEEAKAEGKKSNVIVLCAFFVGIVVGLFVLVKLTFIWLNVLSQAADKEAVEQDSRVQTQLWSDGTVYEGMLHNDLPDGLGKATEIDGTVYDGQWRAGMREGFGTETDAENGDHYIGEWHEDQWEGDGILIFGETGNRYQGQF